MKILSWLLSSYEVKEEMKTETEKYRETSEIKNQKIKLYVLH